MTMKTQMDKLIGYQGGGFTGSIGGIDPSQRRGRIIPLPQVIPSGPELRDPDAFVKEGVRPPTDPEGERFRTLPIDEGYRTIQPVPGVRPTFPTVGSPEYERYLEAIKNLPEGERRTLPIEDITPIPDSTTELSPGGPHTSFVGGRDPALVVLGLINKDSTTADVEALVGYVNRQVDNPITISDVSKIGAEVAEFSQTLPGKLSNFLTQRGWAAFVINRFLGTKGESGDTNAVEAAEIAARAQAESTTPADRAAQVEAAAAPQATPATTPSGTVASPFAGGQPAMSTGAASPAGQASGGLVQNMYDGGVVRMVEGGEAKNPSLPEEIKPLTGYSLSDDIDYWVNSITQSVQEGIPNEELFEDLRRLSASKPNVVQGLLKYIPKMGKFIPVLGQIASFISDTKPLNVDEFEGYNDHKIKLTNSEIKFFESSLGSEADRQELLEQVPSLRVNDGWLNVVELDIVPLMDWVGDVVASHTNEMHNPDYAKLGIRIPPRLRGTSFFTRLETGIQEVEPPIDYPKEVFHSTTARRWPEGSEDIPQINPEFGGSDIGFHVMEKEGLSQYYRMKEGIDNIYTIPLKGNIDKTIKIPDMGRFRNPINWIREMSTSQMSHLSNKELEEYSIRIPSDIARYISEVSPPMYVYPEKYTIEMLGDDRKEALKLWKDIIQGALKHQPEFESGKVETSEKWIKFLQNVLDKHGADAFSYENYKEGAGKLSYMILDSPETIGKRIKSAFVEKPDPTKPELGKYKGGQVRPMYDGGLV